MKTYAIAIKKINESGLPLANATFQLPDGLKVKADGTKANEYVVSNANDAVSTLTTPDNGVFVIRGVKSGNYALTEISAPSGYTKLKTPVNINAEVTSATTTHFTKTLTSSGTASPSQMKDGTYTATERCYDTQKGKFDYNITATITVSNHQITDVSLSADDGGENAKGYYNDVFKQVSATNLNIDAVSGATYSSNSAQKALQDAQANITMEAGTSSEESVTITYDNEEMAVSVAPVINKKGSLMPETGGTGKNMLAASGISLMLGAAIFKLTRKFRKSK